MIKQTPSNYTASLKSFILYKGIGMENVCVYIYIPKLKSIKFMSLLFNKTYLGMKRGKKKDRKNKPITRESQEK